MLETIKLNNCNITEEQFASTLEQTRRAAELMKKELEQKEGVEALDEAVNQLQVRERQLFEMRQQEGLSIEEIAQQTGIPKASVQSMIAMARKKVFNEMKRRMNR